MNNFKLTKQISEKIIRKGWPLLEEDFNQEELRTLMADKGVVISSSSLSNIYRTYTARRQVLCIGLWQLL